LPEEEGRRSVSSDSKPAVVRVAPVRAALDAGKGALRRGALLTKGSFAVELLRLEGKAEAANRSPHSAALVLVEGRCRLRGEGVAGGLGREQVLILKPGERLELRSVGDRPFYALWISVDPALEAAAEETASPLGADPPSSASPDVEWVRIPGGRFRMGSGLGDEGPVHEVAVKTFEISKAEVTEAAYRRCVEAGGCTAPDPACAGPAPRPDLRPVVCVSWAQASAFAKWIGGRLPTEAEWEYAARGGGKDRKFPWGDAEADCSRAVVNHGDGRGCGRNAAWPVCSKPAGDTEQGLCDMAGNVWEWVEDWYHRGYEGAPSDGSAWLSPPTKQRVQRGGSWIFTSMFARTTARSGDVPELAGDYLGFRVARSAR
jgi:formylglycine-generating enzyme required for sulfatase activity